MVNPSKRKGTAFETEVVNHLRARGFDECERRALTGTQDRGDIAGIVNWTIECKNQNTSLWAAWMDELAIEKKNAGTRRSLLVVRRRMAVIERAYAVMPLAEAIDVIIDLENSEMDEG